MSAPIIHRACDCCRELATAQRELEEARRDSVRLDYALAECAKVNATARGNFYLPQTRGGIDAAMEGCK